MKSQLTIIIRGKEKSGRTGLAGYLKDMLDICGAKVTLEDDESAPTSKVNKGTPIHIKVELEKE
jgi:hypothetical protein